MILSDQDIQVVWAAMQANAQTIFTHGYDADAGKEIEHPSFAELEEQIHSDLLSGDPQQVRRGLASVFWWGMHGGDMRNLPLRFQELIAHRHVEKFELAAALLPALDHTFNTSPFLHILKGLHLPGFSGISYVSKLRMFLSPARYVVLDRKLLRMRNPANTGTRNLLDAIAYEDKPGSTSILINDHNEAGYMRWSTFCRRIAQEHLQGYTLHGREVIAADVERGFFYLVSNDRTDEGREILNRAAI